MKNAIGTILSGTDEKVIPLFPQGVGHLSSELCLQLVWAEITKKGAQKAVSWEEECEILDLGTRCISWQFLIQT